jgi:hypothetical protein
MEEMLMTPWPESASVLRKCVCLRRACSPIYLTPLLGGLAHCLYGPGVGEHLSFRVVKVTWIGLDPLAFILHF